MVHMCHSFLLHSSADGHLGCFHVLAMINSAARKPDLKETRAPQCSSVFLKFKYVYKSPWDLVKMWSLIQSRACPSNKSPRERAAACAQHLPVRSKPRSSLGICSKPPSFLFPSSSYLIGSLIYSPTDQLPITLLILPHSLFSSTCLYFFGCAGSSMQHAGFS